MTAEPETLEISRCASCQARFLPTDAPCPRCGSTEREPYAVAAGGTVLASTELVHPAAGWESPHRLALVEVAEEVRLLAIVDGELPAVGSAVRVRLDGDIYRARAEDAPGPERGEGESPRTGAPGASFEPPR